MTPERAVEWFAERGIPFYKDEIARLEAEKAAARDEIEWIAVEHLIRDWKMRAHDRVTDWETDVEFD